MPSAVSETGGISVLNCGFVRERGIERTSTQRAISASASKAVKAAIERVECPIVKTGLVDGAGSDGVSPDIRSSWRGRRISLARQRTKPSRRQTPRDGRRHLLHSPPPSSTQLPSALPLTRCPLIL